MPRKSAFEMLKGVKEELEKTKNELHRPKRKMRQNAVMSCISYNYVSSNLLNVPL
jgi:hypothetical protein